MGLALTRGLVGLALTRGFVGLALTRRFVGLALTRGFVRLALTRGFVGLALTRGFVGLALTDNLISCRFVYSCVVMNITGRGFVLLDADNAILMFKGEISFYRIKIMLSASDIPVLNLKNIYICKLRSRYPDNGKYFTFLPIFLKFREYIRTLGERVKCKQQSQM